MITVRERQGKIADDRFVDLPWDEETPQWQEIDQGLPADHLARQVDEAVEELDLAGLFATYSGRGSKALWPDRLLRLVLYEMQRGQLSPAQWFLESRESDPAQWLLFGMKPSRTAWYEFFDRLQGFWDDWNEQLLHKAQELGLSIGDRVALDGTLTELAIGRAERAEQRAQRARAHAADAREEARRDAANGDRLGMHMRLRQAELQERAATYQDRAAALHRLHVRHLNGG